MSMNKLPRFTVGYNIGSGDRRWIGTGWEFFDSEEDAERCYKQLVAQGHVPFRRPFHRGCDIPHMAAAHDNLRAEFREDINKFQRVLRGEVNNDTG